MPISDDLLAILACPACKGSLTYLEDEDKLICEGCARVYDIRDDIPIMLIDEAGVDPTVLRTIHPELSEQPRSKVLPNNDDHSFTATYFPWSIITNEDTMKRALLYFDRIYLLTPTRVHLDELLEEFRKQRPRAGFRSPNFDTDLRSEILSFYSRIKPLMDEGIVVPIDSNSVLSDPTYRKQLAELSFDDAINYDVAVIDPKLKLGVQYLDPDSAIAHEALPGGMVSFQYWKATEAVGLYSDVLERVEQYISALPPHAQVMMQKMIKLPDAVIRAVLINASLLCIQRAGSAPLTDDPDDLRILMTKYERISDARLNKDAKANKKTLLNFVAHSNTKSGMLTNFVLELLVPNVNYLNVEDCLELREKFRDHLELFRLKMRTLSSEIQGTIADAEFYEQCQNTIQKEIVPPLLDLQKKIKFSKMKILKDFSKSAFSLKPTVPFIISAFAPLPLYAAALVAAGIISLETALDMYIERRDLLYNNGLAYLLDINNKGIKIDRSFWGRSQALASIFKS